MYTHITRVMAPYLSSIRGYNTSTSDINNLVIGEEFRFYFNIVNYIILCNHAGMILPRHFSISSVVIRVVVPYPVLKCQYTMDVFKDQQLYIRVHNFQFIQSE